MSQTTIPIKFSLIQKLVASYSAIALFTLTALVFSLSGLYSITRTAKDIARHDLLVISSTLQLRESLVAQERASGKFAILKTPEYIDLYRQRAQEFSEILQTLKQHEGDAELAELAGAYGKYQAAVEDVLAARRTMSPQQGRLAAQLLQMIDSLSTKRQQQLNRKLAEAEEKERSTVRLALVLSLSGFLLATIVAVYVVVTISTAITKLKKATHRIAEGDFDYDPHIPPGDEIGDLASDFISMAARLKILEQISLDASPLTRLPGNIAIERVLSKRLQSGEQFAVCYADLDNFKAYNDRYGYVKASEVIKIAAEIVHEVTKRVAGPTAFVGHVGGDDFVVITDADMTEPVCQSIVEAFDREIINHYNAEDLAKGAIEGTDRYGVHRVFPIMTISIAAVICQQGMYDSAVNIAKTAAELKEYLKAKSGSNYFINRRGTQR